MSWTLNQRTRDFQDSCYRLLAVTVPIGWYFKAWAPIGAACLLGIILINCRFYVFFARKRHPLFAALVVPLHVLYFLYSGVALGLGIGLHVWKMRVVGLLRRRHVKVSRAAQWSVPVQHVLMPTVRQIPR